MVRAMPMPDVASQARWRGLRRIGARSGGIARGGERLLFDLDPFFGTDAGKVVKAESRSLVAEIRSTRMAFCGPGPGSGHWSRPPL
ncbi:MAG: hypothetical protein FWD68_04010 [Alphaproteobacteria bacterium]|nr:hypothetical protein [Alphaproteobacteria bacterium]